MSYSVVMTVYNGEDYLAEAIESILNQTFKDFEFIIINDGSNDSTRSIIESYNDDRIVAYHLDENKGQTYCLNYGIKNAKGDWIFRQDADDISLPTRFEKQIKYLSKNPQIVGVGTLIDTIQGKNPVDNNTLQSMKWSNSCVSREEIRKFRFVAPPIVHGTILFSKKAFYKAGGYCELYKIGQDTDLWIKLMEIGDIDKVNKVLYKYRVYYDSLSRKDETETCRESMLIVSRNIHSIFIKKRNSIPKFVVIGPEKGCEFYKKFIEFNSGIHVVEYLSKDVKAELKRIDSLFHIGKINGIILLDGLNYKKIYPLLESHGFIYNDNLFRLWNIIT
ncbi:glycosyltransferase [Bacillus sp. ISL-46]|uniref:glycosyltransferase n=1 Tax=Bacillus sp. ISL-46 TaxID=2819129 RepID=UPI001BE62899|nr:glycosyltransferase [Bacillus sp. ISL-46]MBT2724656.1 glycosyltransferase [Bacillus sp. ISL-46]